MSTPRAALARAPGYRRLLGVRFAAQWADGIFQAALGGALLFNPERQADPLAVAAGLAVLLLPYSLVGPFAGALLDRLDRRTVLVGAQLLRVALVGLVAAVVAAGVAGPGLYVAALAVAGVSRFVLAGLSTALPHVVEKSHLVEANTFAVTAGAVLSALGAASAIGLRWVLGSGDAGSAGVVLAAAAGSLLSAALAVGFGAGTLGPTWPAVPAGTDGAGPSPTRRPRVVVTVLRGYADGFRAAAAAAPVAATFLALAAHRLAFGITTLVTLLAFRYSFTEPGPLPTGYAGVGTAVLVAAAGLGVAAVVTPWLVRRMGRPRTVRVALTAAAVTQLGLAVLLGPPAVFVAAFLIGLAGQVVKLCTDAAVQVEARDGVLGRVFALYDIVFNVGYVLAVTAAALLSPPDGDAPGLLAATAALYLLGLVAHDARLRRERRSGVVGRPAT